MKIFLEYFEKFFGREITFALVFVIAGWFGNSYINNTFMTNEAYADHHVEIIEKIDKATIVQDQKLLMYEKRGLDQQKIQLIVEISKNPSNVDLKDGLVEVKSNIKDIDEEIKTNNMRLAK